MDSNGILKFGRNYINGKRNEKGKQYSLYGELNFEGEYLNNKKFNGKGKEGIEDFNFEG